MLDHGLSNVMEVMKRQKWESLFKRRELVHTDAVKEFYAKSIMSHNRKKDVAKSKVRGVEIVIDHLQLPSILGIPGNNGIFPEEEDEEEEKDQIEFDWEAVIDKAAEQGESGSDDQFFDAQVEVEELVTETPAAPAVPAPSTVQQKVTETSGVDSSCPTGRIPEVVINKLQVEFKRARVNRFQADLEKAQAENARLLALLHQAQTKPKP
ncbi:hypothetical protein Dimus_031495 [Dionaea muscipula]